MGAAHAGALEPLRLLLAAGAPVDVLDSHGYTALMLACNAGHPVCVRLLLGAGADVEGRDNEGLTSIMFAAQNGHDEIVRILMERGADPNVTSSGGMSAVSLAKQKGHEQTAALLLGGYELPRLAQYSARLQNARQVQGDEDYGDRQYDQAPLEARSAAAQSQPPPLPDGIPLFLTELLSRFGHVTTPS